MVSFLKGIGFTNIKLGRKILFSTLAVMLLSISTIVFLVNTVVQREVEQDIQSDLKRTRLVFDSFYSIQEQETIIKNQLLGHISFVKALVRSKNIPAIEQFSNDFLKKTASDLFIVTDENGITLANTVQGKGGQDLSSLPAFIMAMEDRHGSGLLFQEDRIFLIFTYVLKSGPMVFGTISMGYLIDDLYAEKLTDMTLSQTSFLMDGHVVASAWQGPEWIALENALVKIDDVIQSKLLAGDNSLPFDMTIGSEIYSTMLIPVMDGKELSEGYYLIQVSRDKAMSIYYHVQQLILIIGFIAIVLAILVSSLVAKQISKPMNILVDVSDHIAKGNLTAEGNIEKLETIRKRHDEIGVLAKSFSSMVNQIKIQTLDLEQRNRELEDFTHISSHDLQEPLRKVSVFSHRLKEKYEKVLEGQGRKYLDRILNSVSRMQTLINDLLSYSLLTKRSRAFAPVDLAQVVQKVVSELEEPIKRKKGSLQIGELPTINADVIQMELLFQNLIGNALKFNKSDDPPVVKVFSTLVKEKQVSQESDEEIVLYQITVEDNGIGFDTVYIEKIFTVFQQLHGMSKYEGNGIGLAICRKIVQQHHGTITAMSTPGQGATFIVQLPINQTQGDIPLMHHEAKAA